ncbi:deoxyribodipyrimidine photo-lyase [Sphingomonas lacunae]|uniref:Deoxyribodipyrimidine photo-lyase n=1 Tax=Sphingomonas lacunae TaxID=2698828 RepID=A0A6M4AVB9_9SPHN|nr:deoxyribodipyrimidine photo-lyase [Sphingomonas lacunae]QJQ33055.1 deoxyribodipyrimidine photo-lyase [Sphingomonas lacunae]
MSAPQIVWFRRDLRLADQAALAAAAAAGPVIPVYILDDETPRHRRMGAASRWWLHHSLTALARQLDERGSRLILRSGSAAENLAKLVAETGASSIHALHHYEPWWRNAETALRKALPPGVQLHLHHGNYLLPPGSVKTGSGTDFKIYTPFWRALNQHMPPSAPLSAPRAMTVPLRWPASEALDAWRLLPRHPDWATGFGDWTPGEAGALAQLEWFEPFASRYDSRRNLPSVEGSSRLSPHLHFGEVSPATVWHRLMGKGGEVETYLKELVWRDYAQNLILSMPDYGNRNGKSQFDALPWRDIEQPTVAAELLAWQQGRTGYPIVDAGMRQLWTTGWMHNRVRMIAASFLIKHLLIDWRVGEQWFWDTLVDADYASNAANWQWVAGSGVDANMFVRIMAPLSQSEKFDAGAYIRRWVPELRELPEPWLHDPTGHGQWVRGYPKAIIGHREARERALAAFAGIKGG